MDKINFLNRLMDYGIKNKYFEISEIGKLDKSCCKKLVIEVIDFDKTEEFHREKHNYQTLKSCDSLKLCHKTPSIDFIEMKGLKNYIFYQLDVNHNIEEQVGDKASKFDFISKIRDSITILNNIVHSQDFMLSGHEKILYYSLKKKFIILTDIDAYSNPIETISLTLEFLAQTSSSIENIVYHHFSEHIDNLEIRNYYNIDKPILVPCNKFGELYS